MPTADLRALAERLEMLEPCRIQESYFDDDDTHRVCGDRCDACDGTGQRLPTEAELRAAIFGAGRPHVDIEAEQEWARVDAYTDDSFVDVVRGLAKAGEAAPDELVLLALLRALEACRG